MSGDPVKGVFCVGECTEYGSKAGGIGLGSGGKVEGETKWRFDTSTNQSFRSLNEKRQPWLL